MFSSGLGSSQLPAVDRLLAKTVESGRRGGAITVAAKPDGDTFGMQIRLLAEVAAAESALAEWFHAEWHRYDGRSAAEIEAQLLGCLNRDMLPITFLALSDSEVIGTISLDTADAALRPSVAVAAGVTLRRAVPRPGRRRAALVKHLVSLALERGLSPIYLRTPGKLRLYQECSWKVLHADVMAPEP